METMKLLLAHPQDPSDPGTWSRTPFNLGAALRQRGADVYDVATGPRSELGRFVYRVAQRVRGSDYTYAESFRRRAAQRVAWAARGCDAEVVIHCGTTAGLPKRGDTARHYLYCDSTWHRYHTLTPDLRILDRGLVSRVDELERCAYSRCEHIFCFSNAVRDDLMTHYAVPEGRVSVVGAGLGNTQPFGGEKDYTSGRILYVAKGAFRRKGGELLARAFRLALARDPKLTLVMDGGGVELSSVAGVPNIHVSGLSSRDELQALFNRACLYAMPALFEPWGYVYIEALASRTPILGLNRNSLPDITHNGRFGFLVEEPRPEDVASAILDAMSDPKRLEEMGREGQRYVLENYTWDVVASRMMARIAHDH